MSGVLKVRYTERFGHVRFEIELSHRAGPICSVHSRTPVSLRFRVELPSVEARGRRRGGGAWGGTGAFVVDSEPDADQKLTRGYLAVVVGAGWCARAGRRNHLEPSPGGPKQRGARSVVIGWRHSDDLAVIVDVDR